MNGEDLNISQIHTSFITTQSKSSDDEHDSIPSSTEGVFHFSGLSSIDHSHAHGSKMLPQFGGNIKNFPGYQLN
jgi:hypothetical protein